MTKNVQLKARCSDFCLTSQTDVLYPHHLLRGSARSKYYRAASVNS